MLRRAAREHQTVVFPNPTKMTAAALALQKSYPRWIIGRWVERYGMQTTASLCDSLNTIPPITIRTNTHKTSRERLIAALGPEADQIEPTEFSPDGINFRNPTVPISQMKTFKDGWFQVQDEAAQLVTLLLDPQPGEKILDACAGLGGKSGHIAQLMKNHGQLIAADNRPDKLDRLAGDMRRLGNSNVTLQVQDLAKECPAEWISSFDRILLDAPCSGFGVVRRNPDIKWQGERKNLKALKTRQLRLLENLARSVRPSGTLVYAVCSPEPEENEAVIDEFLKKHQEFVISDDCGRLPDEFQLAAESAGAFRTFPRLSMMDGFFFIRLERIS
jgi:16S rRNA (cytosine967-C5)-methyltransferase